VSNYGIAPDDSVLVPQRDDDPARPTRWMLRVNCINSMLDRHFLRRQRTWRIIQTSPRKREQRGLFLEREVEADLLYHRQPFTSNAD